MVTASAGERRRKLAPLAGSGGRYRFRATVAKSGIVPSQPRYMLAEIRCGDTGERLAQHCWVGAEAIDRAGIKPGQTISFTAKVYCYNRNDGTETYGLGNIKHVKVENDPE